MVSILWRHQGANVGERLTDGLHSPNAGIWQQRLQTCTDSCTPMQPGDGTPALTRTYLTRGQDPAGGRRRHLTQRALTVSLK